MGTMFAIIVACVVDTSWNNYKDQSAVVYNVWNDMFIEKDTVMVRHFHQSGGRIYVITDDGDELWCDGIRLMRGGCRD